MAQAGKYPTVNFNADYDVFTPDLARGNDSWFVGVVVNFTLFDGRRTRNDVRQAEAKLQEIRARQQRLVLDIELGVRRTWLQLEDAKQRLEVTSQTIGQAQESLREIEQRYGGQIATITQLVDAQVRALQRAGAPDDGTGRGRDRPRRAGAGNRETPRYGRALKVPL